MINLETKRLILRNYKPEDFNDVFAYFNNDEVSEYEDFYPMTELCSIDWGWLQVTPDNGSITVNAWIK